MRRIKCSEISGFLILNFASVTLIVLGTLINNGNNSKAAASWDSKKYNFLNKN